MMGPWYARSVSLPSDPNDVSGEPFPLPEMDTNGVDLGQIREMLALNPFQRLQVLESALASMIRLRSAISTAEVSRDPAQAR